MTLAGNLLQCSSKTILELTLVLWPAMRMERLTTGDFISAPPKTPLGTGWSGVLVHLG